ncbi:hypothetical protein WME88_55690 [Sorangium sp. So ce216]
MPGHEPLQLPALVLVTPTPTALVLVLVAPAPPYPSGIPSTTTFPPQALPQARAASAAMRILGSVIPMARD